jgi:LmbE family N-acetylglucosaminyl deacetylase
MQVRNALRDNVNTDHKTVSSIAKAVIQAEGREDIFAAGFRAGKSWCNTLLREMNLRHRRVTTESAKLPADWEEQAERLAMQARHSKQLLPRHCFLWLFVRHLAMSSGPARNPD